MRKLTKQWVSKAERVLLEPHYNARDEAGKIADEMRDREAARKFRIEKLFIVREEFDMKKSEERRERRLRHAMLVEDLSTRTRRYQSR